jgi:hypothetical protein
LLDLQWTIFVRRLMSSVSYGLVRCAAAVCAPGCSALFGPAWWETRSPAMRKALTCPVDTCTGWKQLYPNYFGGLSVAQPSHGWKKMGK